MEPISARLREVLQKEEAKDILKKINEDDKYAAKFYFTLCDKVWLEKHQISILKKPDATIQEIQDEIRDCSLSFPAAVRFIVEIRNNRIPPSLDWYNSRSHKEIDDDMLCLGFVYVDVKEYETQIRKLSM